ncbi:MAG TPA: PBP1A family penicillin-binding protein [Terriglobales bacterium]|jgi:penicillin-binding protein 1A|nr:PBP1A family penicillin-binding protein [Terriglobales bacterium]
MKLLDADRPPVEVRTPEEAAARRRLIGWIVYGVLVLAAAGAGSLGGLLFVYNTDLPQVDDLEHYRPISNTELFDDQGRVIGSFALQRRVVARFQDYPPVLRQAVISIEDKNFEKHWGVNVWRVLGAAWRDLISGGKVQGASTLTMQLSRNLFLSPERTYGRKLEEILLAIQIERRFTKAQIFTLYANQIFLGHGVYGFETGAQFYFGKHARDLTLPEAALLAGLPKAPSYYSPINNPERALRRRNLVINSMLEDGKITAAEATAAKEEPIRLNLQTDPNSLAPYYVEEIRQYLEKKYGSDQVHQGGLRVYTTLDMDMQKAANQAVLDGLAAYEHRHGWKGRLENVLLEGRTLESYHNPDWDETLEPGSYVHALVTEASAGTAVVKFGRYFASLGPEEVAWTRKRVSQLLAPGDVAYVKVISLGPDSRARVALEQDSGVQGALVAIDNATGDIKAMVGGRDFDLSKFNHATQAERQVGSSFKPYVYTAAIDQGATPDDVVLDAPVTFNTPSGPYIPHNYDEKFEGNITLRRALANSRNIPALKTAEKVGIETVISYAHRFGISEEIPDYLPIALGAADATVLEQTSAFSVFPEDGVRLLPRYISKVTDYDGRLLEENYPDVRDVISQRTARIMTSMLREVVLHGTGVAASRMPYALAGKTGTTNDFTDAWFVGFSPNLTCGVWVGFDQKKSLGNKETGSRAALPIWMEFMSAALKGHDPGDFQPPPPLPPGAVAQRVDTPDSAPAGDEAH